MPLPTMPERATNATLLDGCPEVLQKLKVVLGFIVAGLAKLFRQSIVFHNFTAHAQVLITTLLK